MDPSTWTRIHAVLEQALELPPADVDAFLDTACAGDPELRAEVAALIAADRSAPAFLDRPAFVVRADPVPSLAGRRLGPFRIVREIGRGGMSVVYLAERTEPFAQTVAIKVLQRDAPSAELRARFDAERRILAALDHRGIVRILDGGVTEDGRPYLVMEHITGERIDAWCDRRRLTVSERLLFFREVLDAVSYAHRSLIVHRDLKPSNILISDTGEVRLLDFGIAKIIEPDAAGDATLTGRRVLTPEYASPEQIRGERVTTASDVYALGVLLYELLTGRRPYALESPTPWALENAALETEPQRPSDAVARRTAADAAPAAERIAAARSTEPARLRSTLEGDLDAILLKALRKEPDARYASVDAFAADIDRFADSLPVLARRGSRGYQMRKFVRRHRVGVAVAAVVALFFVAGSIAIAAAWQAADTQRIRAEREARTATEVSDFLVGVFGGSDPTGSLGDTVSARTLLERGRARIDRELQGEPAVRASMLAAIGNAYSGLGRFETADTLLGEALRIREIVHEDPVVIARTWYDLAANRGAERSYPEAIALAERALDVLAAGPDDPELRADIAVHLATALHGTGEADSARSVIEDALRFDRLRGDSTSANHLDRLVVLATTLRALERYDSAAAVYRAALPRIEALSGRRSDAYAVGLNNTAYLLTRVDRSDEAVPLYQEALSIRRDLYGPDHPYVWLQLSNLASAYDYTDRMDDAIALGQERAASIERAYPDGHWRVGAAHETTGEMFMRARRFAEAEAEFRLADRAYIATLGVDHVWTRIAEAWAVLAITLQDEASGTPLLDRVLTVLDGAEFDPDTTADVGKIADYLDAAGLRAYAEAFRALPERGG